MAGVLVTAVQLLQLLIIVPLAFRSIDLVNAPFTRVELKWLPLDVLPVGTTFLYHANRLVTDNAWLLLVLLLIVTLTFRFLIRPQRWLLAMLVLALVLLVQSIWVPIALLHYWFNFVDVIN